MRLLCTCLLSLSLSLLSKLCVARSLSLSLLSCETAVHHFPFSHLRLLLQRTDGRTNGLERSINLWDTSHSVTLSHLISLCSIHSMQQRNPAAELPNMPSSNIVSIGGAEGMPMPIFASIFCPPAALAPTSGLSSSSSLPLCFSSPNPSIRREGRKWRVLKLSDHFAQLPISHHPLSFLPSLSLARSGSEKSGGVKGEEEDDLFFNMKEDFSVCLSRALGTKSHR